MDRRSRTVWEEGHLPGTHVAAAAAGVSLVVVLLDLAVTGRISLLFDVVFVALCVGTALLVRPRDFFIVGVLPPLLMLTAFVLLAIVHRPAIAEADDGVVQAVVSGLSHHALTLGIGYGLCLAVLGLRDRIARGLLRPGGLTRATDRIEVRTGPGLRRLREARPEPRPTSRRRSSARPGSRRLR